MNAYPSIWRGFFSRATKHFVFWFCFLSNRLEHSQAQEVPYFELTGHSNDIGTVAFSPDGTKLASACRDATVRIWDLESRQTIGILPHSESVWSVTWSPDSSMVATGTGSRDNRENEIRIWDVEAMAEVMGSPLKGHSDDVYSVDWSPDGTKLVSGSGDATIRVWNVDSMETIGNPIYEGSEINSVKWNPDSSRLASGSEDHFVRLWDMSIAGQSTGEVFTGHLGDVRAVDWSPDGTMLASGNGATDSHDVIIVWNVISRQQIGNDITGHTGGILSVAWSPEGSKLVSCSWDETIRVWDVDTGQQLQTLSGHIGAVRTVAWHPDGTQLASGGADTVIRIWSLPMDVHPLPVDDSPQQSFDPPILQPSLSPTISPSTSPSQQEIPKYPFTTPNSFRTVPPSSTQYVSDQRAPSQRQDHSLSGWIIALASVGGFVLVFGSQLHSLYTKVFVSDASSANGTFTDTMFTSSELGPDSSIALDSSVRDSVEDLPQFT